jgi:hypothetical protein
MPFPKSPKFSSIRPFTRPPPHSQNFSEIFGAWERHGRRHSGLVASPQITRMRSWCPAQACTGAFKSPLRAGI